MEVSSIAYVTEESWGIGMPGDNETGVIAYNLPDRAMQGIDAQGIGYFRQLSCAKGWHDWHGRYDEWQETPILADEKWGTPGPSRLANYLNRYGFGIPVSGPIGAAIDGAISGPGSFYAYGRIGMILVVPRKRQAFFVYTG